MPVETTPVAGFSRQTEAMRVRCPSCRKLYMVQFNDIREAKPRFECVQCHSRFWLSLAGLDLRGRFLAIPMQMKESPAAKPAAAVPAPIVNARPKSNLPPHSSMLADAWQRLVADYASDRLHDDFIRMASRERNLAYAGAQYGQMLKLMPSDETTQKRLHEIQALGSAMLPPREPVKTRSLLSQRLWQMPLAAAVVLIVAGLFIPFFRQLVGVGAALLFLALALQFQLRRR